MGNEKKKDKEIIFNLTTKEVAEGWNKKENFVRQAIALGKVKAKKAGHIYLLPQTAIEDFKRSPFQITRKEVC